MPAMQTTPYCQNILKVMKKMGIKNEFWREIFEDVFYISSIDGRTDCERNCCLISVF